MFGRMRAIRGLSEIDRRDFAVKWENIRAAYYADKGDAEKAKRLTEKAAKLKRELDYLLYRPGSFY